MSSNFWSPCDRFPLTTLALVCRPSCSMTSQALSRVCARGNRPCICDERPSGDISAPRRDSSTVRVLNSLATWNARPMPLCTISLLGVPTMFSPSSRILPESGCRAPEMRLKNVVLPAPLGPITALSDSLRKWIDTSDVAITPPNDLQRFSIRSITSLRSIGTAARQEHRRRSSRWSRPASRRRLAG